MIIGHCKRCTSESINLQVFNKTTGALLWNRFEPSMHVDNNGDVWSTRTETLTEQGGVGSRNSAQSGHPETLPHRTMPSVFLQTLHNAYSRKYAGATGILDAEYFQYVGTTTSGFGVPSISGEPGEGIKDGVHCQEYGNGVFRENATVVRLLIDSPVNTGKTITYYLGPVMNKTVDSVELNAGTVGASLPGGVSTCVLQPADNAATVQSAFTTAFGSAVDSVTVTGDTLDNQQLKIEIEWAHTDYYMANWIVYRDFPAAIVGACMKWDLLNAKALSAGWMTSGSTWSGSGPAFWCDDGSVTFFRDVSNSVSLCRIINLDHTTTPWTVNWSAGLYDQTASASDPDPSTEYTHAEGAWRILTVSTRGGYSRAFYVNLLVEGSTPNNFDGYYMTEIADNGTGWERYRNAENPTFFDAQQQNFRLRCITSDSETGFLWQHATNNFIYNNGADAQRNQNVGIYHNRKYIFNSPRIADGQTGPVNQLPQEGISAFFGNPCGFDDDNVYIAGVVEDPTEGETEPVGVASTPQFVGDNTKGAYIDRQFASSGGLAEHHWHFTMRDNLAFSDCQWRMAFYLAPTYTYTEWFNIDADATYVNDSLKTQFGSNASVPTPNDAFVVFETDGTAGGAGHDSRGMVWYEADWLHIVVPDIYTNYPGVLLPAHWEDSSFTLSGEVQLQNIVRKDVKDIASISWDGDTVNWTQYWGHSASAGLQPRESHVHSGRVYIHGFNSVSPPKLDIPEDP